MGREVLQIGLPEQERARLVETIRGLAKKARSPRPAGPAAYDLGAMTPQERLGALVRAAERAGVI